MDLTWVISQKGPDDTGQLEGTVDERVWGLGPKDEETRLNTFLVPVTSVRLNLV